MFYILTKNISVNAAKRNPIDKPNTTLQQISPYLFAGSTDNTTKLAIDLLRVQDEEDMNDKMVVSSFSIQRCLGVINIALGRHSKLQKYVLTHSEFQRILQLYAKSNSRFRVASKFFYKKGSPILDSFKHEVKTYFNSTYEEIKIENNQDFQTHLSSWLKNEGMHSTETTLTVQWNGERRFSFTTLMNFSNEWFHEFSTKNTNMGRFVTKIKNGVTSKYVPMMNIVQNFYYQYFPYMRATAIQLPFSDSETSMLIILPDPESDVYKLQEQLTPNIIKEILGGLFYRTVSVRLPKFSVDTTVHYTDTLSKMGLARMYCEKMHIFDKREFLRAESIVQKNKFTINELGVNTPNIGMNDPTPDIEIPAPYVVPKFHAERPFIFFIQDREDYIFYAGKVTNCD